MEEKNVFMMKKIFCGRGDAGVGEQSLGVPPDPEV
jgi:hypothetical protein